MDLAALKSELQNDPGAYGYSPFISTGQTSILAEMLNEIRSTIDVERELVPAHEIFEAIVPAEWGALNDQEKNRVSMVLSLSEVNVKGTNTRAAFQAAFGAGTETRTNLTNLLTRKGSRGEELFGAGISVSHLDVAAALSL